MGRGSSGAGSGGRVSVTSATNVLSIRKSAFASGNAPTTITVNGVQMTMNNSSQYVSGGGYVVKTYKYTAQNQIAADGRDSITFNATAYKTQAGQTAKGYERRKPRIFSVKITGGVAYSSGSSGGIRTR